MILVRYNTCLGSINVQERNKLFKGLLSSVDVSLKIRNEEFYSKIFIFFVFGKNFKPKKLATIDLTLPNSLGNELVIQRLV